MRKKRDEEKSERMASNRENDHMESAVVLLFFVFVHNLPFLAVILLRLVNNTFMPGNFEMRFFFSE